MKTIDQVEQTLAQSCHPLTALQLAQAVGISKESVLHHIRRSNKIHPTGEHIIVQRNKAKLYSCEEKRGETKPYTGPMLTHWQPVKPWPQGEQP